MDDRWERLREQLIAHAQVFEDPAAYVAGVEDAIAAARDLVTPPTAPRQRLRLVEPQGLIELPEAEATPL